MGIKVCHVAVVCALLALCAAAPSPLCPGLNEQDPETAHFCKALNTFLALYSEAVGEHLPQYDAIARDYPQLFDKSMKRQDVVHSFLRFGRRR